MDGLRHNPIADMYGPYFLLFYGTVITMVVAGCWLALRSTDPSSLPPPPIPVQPDPYEIAYLRGGPNEVTRLAIFSLLQRGYLEVQEHPTKFWQNAKPQQIMRTAITPATGDLSPIDRLTYQW